MMRVTLLGIIVLACGVFFASRETPSLQTTESFSEIVSPPRQTNLSQVSVQNPKPILGQQVRKVAADESKAEELPLMPSLYGDYEPDPAFADEWGRYREEMYGNVQLTDEELDGLKAIAKDDFGLDFDRVMQHYKQLWEKDPDVANKYLDDNGNQRKKLSTKAYESYLGKERYQYLVQARDAFFDTYNKKHGTNIYVADW